MDCQSWQKVNRDNKIQLTQLTLFRSFAQNCAKSLKLKSDKSELLMTKEQIAKVALNKRAKMNNYPRLLITKERP